MAKRLLRFFSVTLACMSIQEMDAYSTNKPSPWQTTNTSPRMDRRVWFQYQASILNSAFVISSWSSLPSIVHAKAAATAKSETLLASIKDAQETLDKLLSNWKRATIDCTYADVPRELLEDKNKELLLEKASTFALFDKSVSVESCKTTNRIVRDYLGVTGKGPLVGIEKKLKQGLDIVLSDDLDDYVIGMYNIINPPSWLTKLFFLLSYYFLLKL